MKKISFFIFSTFLVFLFSFISVSPSPAEKRQDKQLPFDILTPENLYWDIFRVIKKGLIKGKETDFFQPIQVVDKLEAGHSIKTGPKSNILVLINGLDNHNSYIQLEENAELNVLNLEKDAQGRLINVELDILLGEMIVNIENLPAAANFRVKTPYSTADVRGTYFSVKVLPSKIARFLVVRGGLGLSHSALKTEKEVPVREGETLKDAAKGLGKSAAAARELLKIYQKKAAENSKLVKKYALKKKKQAQKDDKDDDEDDDEGDEDDGEGDDEGDEEDDGEGDDEGGDEDDGEGGEGDGEGGEGDQKTGASEGMIGGLTSAPIISSYSRYTPPQSALDLKPPLIIETPSNLPKAHEGQPYSVQLVASGGTPPYTWYEIETSGPFDPPDDQKEEWEDEIFNVYLSPDGVLSGTPSYNSAHTIPYFGVLEVKDADGNTFRKAFTLKVGGYQEGPGWNPIVATGVSGANYNNGFNDVKNAEIFCFAEFNGYLYAGTDNSTEGCELWRTNNGTNWGAVVGGGAATVNGFVNNNNTRISSLCEYNGYLYAGTKNSTANGAEIWKSSNATLWTKILNISSTDWNTDTDNEEIVSLCVFNGYLYAGSYNTDTGAEMWRFDGTDWEAVVDDSAAVTSGFGSMNNIAVSFLYVFNGYLYAGTENDDTGCEIWRSANGTTWSRVKYGGFGNPANKVVSSLIAYSGYLYAGTYNNGGGEVWRSSNGTSWSGAAEAGFGSSGLKEISSFAVFNNALYAGTWEPYDGAGVWVSLGGTMWRPIVHPDGFGYNKSGFGDCGNEVIPALIAFGGRLYAGTDNGADGGELWRLESVYVDPLISGRIYDSSTGENIPGAVASIYNYETSTLIQTSTTNPYYFNVDDGLFYIRVDAEGHTFPSSIISSVTSGDHGEAFAAFGDRMTIDLPLDPGYPLEIVKTANKKTASVGDIVTFNISIRNKTSIAVENIIIKDTLTNGFKLVEGSTYLETTQQTEPVKTGRNLNFRAVEVPASETVNLSYQTRVGVGMEPGTYSTTAFGWHAVRDWRMSNDSVCRVDIVPDPLFTEGTILGKVFRDKNQNGIQDKGEEGIAGVRIVTQNGIVIKTDKDGKYHIPAVLPGTHSLKVDVATLPPGAVFTTENPRVVTLSEGLLSKVNFGIQISANSEPQTADRFFITALGEGVARQMSRSGNIEMVEQSDKFDKDFSLDGKFALYLKGKVKGRYLITASFDSERRPSEYGNTVYKKKFFTNLDPDKYYPVYGDSSEINYDAIDTQDELYVLVEWDESHIKWGSFNTELPLYNRTLHGASIVYKSLKKTKFEEHYTEVKAFAARAFHSSAHDEILATGGSLYYLNENDIVEGSEKIRVDVKDPITQEALASYVLAEEKDYEIDYSTGRILLNRPLSANSYTYDMGIISNEIQRGGLVYLIVDYEYEVFDTFRRDAYGVSVGQHLGDHLKVGGIYVKHDKDANDYRLKGVEGTLRLNKDTFIAAGYNQTEETQMTNNTSLTGGLTATSQNSSISDGKAGHSLSVSAETRLFDNTRLKANYSKQNTDFSATGNTALNGTTTYNGELTSNLTKELSVGLNYSTQKTESSTSAGIGSNNRINTSTGLLNYEKGKWDFRIEQQHQEIKAEIEDYTWQATRQLLDHDITGLRVGYKIKKNSRIYAGGQSTVRGFDNNQFFIGTDFTLNDQFKVSLRETVGNRGDATTLSLSKQVAEGAEKSLEMSTGRDAAGEEYTKTSYGQSTPLSEKSSMYVKNDYSSYQERFRESQVIGTETELLDDLTGDVSYERSHILDELTAISRDCGAVGLAYNNNYDLVWSSRVELRKDNGSPDRTQLVTQNKVLWQVNESYETSLRFNYSVTDNKTQDTEEAKFLELGTGLAYRPPHLDRLNLLAKYSYLIDKNPTSRGEFALVSKDMRHVFALEGVYDLNRYFQLVAKTAYRLLREMVEPRDWLKSDTYLYIGRVNYHLISKWDIGVEYRILANKQSQDSREGWLLEIDRHLGRNFKVGAGYNFTDYSDDLRYEDNYQAKGWFIRVVGKY